ncbi:hypothetical protein [Marinobacter sp.]|uniref:hypothetical protein n=1 Tax=Marinobacter sp. TaxID=50741 RepID=UPI0034A1C394
MKKILTVLLMVAPMPLLAQNQPAHGLSNSVVVFESKPEARQKLDQQASSGAPDKSELSVQSYVDSQERIAETFRRAIPDQIAESSRDDE